MRRSFRRQSAGSFIGPIRPEVEDRVPGPEQGRRVARQRSRIDVSVTPWPGNHAHGFCHGFRFPAVRHSRQAQTISY